MAAVRIERPAAHAGDALGFAQMQLLLLQHGFQLLLLFDVGMGADHAQRLAIGGTGHHPATVQHPSPLTIGLAEAELGAVLLTATVQVLIQRGTHLGDVVGVHARQYLCGGFLTQRGRARHPVAGDVPVPQAVAGAVQCKFPATATINRHRLGHAEGEGEQVAAAVMHGAQVAIVVATWAARQRAGDDATVGSQQAQVFQHRRVGGHRGRQAMLARSRIGRERAPAAVDDDQRRGERMLQQAGDDPLVHAILLRMKRPTAGHAVVNGACGG
ncbi:hypothetical protein D3C71_1072850 [compost metagenome]